MTLNIPSSILNLKGQSVKAVRTDLSPQTLLVSCRRDKRLKARDPLTQNPAIVNRYVRRLVQDLPLAGRQVTIEIELAQIVTKEGRRLMEPCDFVTKGCYYTKRFCQFISGLCRHMTISAVAKHLKLRWETVKNIDKRHLEATLPALTPSLLQGLSYIGVDEVARAKGHDYMTVVYDLVTGQLIWVHEGRTAKTFSSFLKQLPEATKQGILGVAMDMGPSYQKAVKEDLPQADIIFDRFHVMQNFSKAVDNQRRIEFRKADNNGRKLIKGCRYLLLSNRSRLGENQEKKLAALLSANENINAMYALKEQLQELWSCDNYDEMANALEEWSAMAEQTSMTYIRKFAQSLRHYKVGICNYAKHAITTARIEAGNVGIGLIRKRARGIHDTEYFKLKIRQLSVPDKESVFYPKMA